MSASSAIPDAHNAPQTRFLIAGTPRSGTNWLVTELDAHPEIFCGWEILDEPEFMEAPAFAGHPWEGLQAFYSASREGKKAAGFKLMYFHCWINYPEHRQIWDKLEADTDIRIIFLTRQNLLRLMVSWETAKQTSQWAVKPGEKALGKALPCVLDPTLLLQSFADIEEGFGRMRSVFAAHPHIDLTYEQLVTANGPCQLAVHHFLGVTPAFQQGRTLKQETRTLREAIRNYDQVAETLAGTRYEWFLTHPEPGADY